MTKKLLQKLCCPMDKHDLEMNIFNEGEDGEILEGLLTCPECSRYFPVIYGIPILIPDEYRDESLERPLLKEWGFELTERENSELPLLEEKSEGQNSELRIELLFEQPYCKIKFLLDCGIAKRQTAGDYLSELEKAGILKSKKVGREQLYWNTELYKLLSDDLKGQSLLPRISIHGQFCYLF